MQFVRLVNGPTNRLVRSLLWGLGGIVLVIITAPVTRFVDVSSGEESLRTEIDSDAVGRAFLFGVGGLWTLLALGTAFRRAVPRAARWWYTRPWRAPLLSLLPLGVALVAAVAMAVRVHLPLRGYVIAIVGGLVASTIDIRFNRSSIDDQGRIRADGERRLAMIERIDRDALPIAQPIEEQLAALRRDVQELRMLADRDPARPATWTEWWKSRPRRSQR